MGQSQHNAITRHSLLIRLLGGFLAVILILLSFNLFSFSFFSRTIRDEVIQSNSHSLQNTAQRYENHIRIVHSTIARLYFTPHVLLISELANAEEHDAVNQIVQEIRNIIANELLLIDNIILQFRKNHFVIDKQGPDKTEVLFSRFYTSSSYGPDFWQEQLNQQDIIHLFPVAQFKDHPAARTGYFAPAIFMNKMNNALYIAAMLNVGELFRSFHQDVEQQFYLLDADNQLIYQHGNEPLPPEMLGRFDYSKGYFKDKHTYYFFAKGATGLSYVTAVSDESLAKASTRLTYVLLGILALAVGISILISVFLSLKFNQPVRGIINMIQQAKPGRPLETNINEFNFIHDRITHIIQANRDIHHDLSMKAAKLRHFNVLNQLKNIYSTENHFADPNKQFYLVLFHVLFTRQFHHSMIMSPERTTYLVKELIESVLSETFPDIAILQAEKDEIVALVFTDEPNGKLRQQLEYIVHVIDNDKAMLYLTIAYQPRLYEPAEATYAYEQAKEIALQRKLTAETEIITESGEAAIRIGLSPRKEREYASHIRAANEALALDAVLKALQQLDKRAVPAAHYYEFARDITAKTLAVLLDIPVDIGSILENCAPYEKIRLCATVEDFEHYFELFISTAINCVKEVKATEVHPAREALLDYIHTHYQEDISLESVADQLQMSAGYISKLFKEQTGQNFSDYVNDLRMEKAKELLCTTSLQIQDISEQVGYTSANSFIRMFKKATGMPPGEYRRLNTRGGRETV